MQYVSSHCYSILPFSEKAFQIKLPLLFTLTCLESPLFQTFLQQKLVFFWKRLENEFVTKSHTCCHSKNFFFLIAFVCKHFETSWLVV